MAMNTIQRLSKKGNAAFVASGDSGYHPQNGGFTCSIWTQQAKNAPSWDTQANLLNRSFAGIPFGNLVQIQNMFHRLFSTNY
jgi:hypothetical protein